MANPTNRAKKPIIAALSAVALCWIIAYFVPFVTDKTRSALSLDDEIEVTRSLESALSPHIEIPSDASTKSIIDLNTAHPGRARRLSEALPNGGCQLTWPVKPKAGIAITYAASYPGCGARMTWNLVEALTGLWTGDDWNNNGRGSEVVTVKTHYPQSNGILVDFDLEIKRGFIVIRNPMKSIPSFFNHIYEMRNHLPVHSERAPLEEWIKWRDHYLDVEIAEYKKFITYWMDRYSPENRLLITYEGLTDDLIGAEVAKGLNDFLGQVDGVNPIARDSVGCIWRAVVKNEPPPQQAAQIAKLQEQAKNLPQNEQQATGEVSPSQPQQQESSSSQQQQQQSGEGGLQLTGTQTLEEQLAQANAKLAELNTQKQSLSAPQQIVGGSLSAPQQIVGGSSPQQLSSSPQQQQQLSSSSYSQQQIQQAQPLQSSQLQQPQQYASSAQQQQPQQQLTSQSGGLRRRLDPGHHDSQRKGPEVPRPYTPEQLDKMMNMLLEVAEKYQNDDVRLYHIMMGYYEKIREERGKISKEDGTKIGSPPGGYY